jgi:hypothetical protein
MHTLSHGLVLAYHGCDEDVVARLVDGDPFKRSENPYDWLGHGVYFWEANPKRGLDFAEELKAAGRGGIVKPAVVGAVIDLGRCLDLTSKGGIDAVEAAHRSFVDLVTQANADLPENNEDGLRRNLDCAVINHLIQLAEEAGETETDTVRGVFIEGKPLYETAGFYRKTHVQIAVRNSSCIKGVFRVQSKDVE